MIYFVRAGSRVKIGFTDNLPQRLVQLQTANADPLILEVAIDGDRNLEAQFHEQFKDYRLNGEWFSWQGALRMVIETIRAGARPKGREDIRLLCEYVLSRQYKEQLEAATKAGGETGRVHMQLRDWNKSCKSQFRMV